MFKQLHKARVHAALACSLKAGDVEYAIWTNWAQAGSVRADMPVHELAPCWMRVAGLEQVVRIAE